MKNIINKARENFQLLTLRTFNPEADAFYKAIGFKTEPKIAFATHHLILKEYKEL